MSSSLNVFVPVYNEIESGTKIEENVRRFCKVFPDVRFFFYDNASVDGTAEFLLGLCERYPDHVSVVVNSENVGFQRNLAKIGELPSDRMILILGANDQVYTPGLRKLRSILAGGEYDLVVCNTCYVAGPGRGRMLENEEKRVLQPFSTTSMDEYFRNHGTIPNGIMQYVIHPRYKHLFGVYVSWMSPQVAVFFDVFPGRVCYLPPPPVALVNRVEGAGWRSTKEGIIETHMVLAKDIVGRAWELYLDKKMCLWTYMRIRFSYTHAVMFLVYRSFMSKKYWGRWQTKGFGKLVFAARIWRDLLIMRPHRLTNPLYILTVSGAFIYYQLEFLVKKMKKIIYE